MGLSIKDNGPAIIALDPGSLLATKMVREGFCMAGHDIRIGVDILARVALPDEFADATGKYFDNDVKQFAAPHRDALDPDKKMDKIVSTIKEVLTELGVSV